MPENLNEFAICVAKLFVFGVFFVALSHKVRQKKLIAMILF